MTALDQAIIRAFSPRSAGTARQEAVVEAVTAPAFPCVEPAASVAPPPETAAPAAPRTEPAKVALRLDSASAAPPRPAFAARPTPRSEVVTQAMARPEVFTTVAARPAVPLSQALAELATAQPVHATVATVSLDSLMAETVKRPAAKAARTAAVAKPKTPPPSKPQNELINEPVMTYRTDPGQSTLPPLPHLAMTATQPGPAAEELRWRPMLQVDALVWPSMEDRLRKLAAQWMDQLAVGLTNLLDRGQKVLGFGCRVPGEGVTTMLLGAARRLVEQGLRVAVVDANLTAPNLAQSLGLLPEVGWADMLGGSLPLEEVVVESLSDGLVILPLDEPLDATALEPMRIAATLQILAENYDAVLVDLGPLEPSASGAARREIARRVDAVVLVQNVRSTAADRLAGLRSDLAGEGVVHAGTIQNFVAG